jgi:CspA family cold shock protein
MIQRSVTFSNGLTGGLGLGPSPWRPSIRFGFILAESQEYFFHRSDVTGGSFEDLKDGDTVEFDVGESPKGPRAERIRKK